MMKTYIYNKVKRMMQLGLSLLALLPLHAYGEKYGILWEDNSGANTWRYQYETKIQNGELPGKWESFAKGDGTVSSPYLIESVWDLCRLEYHVNDRRIDFKGKYFKLVNDIDLDGYMWYPIGVAENPYESTSFGGYFDGNGKTVKNMKMTLVNSQLTSKYSYGLFGKVKGAIRNLNMTGAQITMNVNTDETNDSRSLSAGLLCGSLLHDYDAKIYGAVYGCHVQGKIEGWMKNKQNDYRSSYVGGVVGYCDNPASVYKCQADVIMNLTDVYYIGGVVGYSTAVTTLPDFWINMEYDDACVSYIFDCVANVDITATITNAPANHCGGICGASYHNIFACAATGTISSVPASGKSAYIGGLAGTNGYNIMGCVSMVRLQGGTKVGGLIGDNSNKITDLIKGHVLNCVYSSHIDSPHAEEVHGLVGNQDEKANKPVNCLFLGTMRPGTTKAPLSSGDTENCYADVNLYDDDDKDNNNYLMTSIFTSALPAFTAKVKYYNYWDSKLREREEYLDISASSDWEHVDGFYPRLSIGADNIANAGDRFENNVTDYVINRAANAFLDDVSAIRTPSLLQNYAWLASVPASMHNGLSAQYLDAPLSLTPKEQNMETIGNVTKVKTAKFSLPTDQTLMTVSGETATPKEDQQGDVLLTITSSDGISKQLCLQVNTIKKWDQKIARAYDAGDGTDAKPYIIHNARQLMKALTTNEAPEYYKLKNDIWFNQNLITENGAISDTGVAWDHDGNNNVKGWKAHLDGDSHAIRGLYASSAFSLLGNIGEGASIENTAFVDCAVKTELHASGYGGFLAREIGANAVVNNCLFDGLYHRLGTGTLRIGGLCWSFGGEYASGNLPTIQDCVLAFRFADILPSGAIVSSWEDNDNSNLNDKLPPVHRVLVLNNLQTSFGLYAEYNSYTTSFFPEGYLPLWEMDAYNRHAKSVEEMTNGTFFTGEGYEKWTCLKGRYPMLTSFAGTAFGKLISLPIFTTRDNGLNNMNYLLDFTPSRATWTATTSDITVDQDIRVLEPKATSKSLLLVRSMDGARMVTPLSTEATIQAGIKFTDVEAKKFCLEHYDENNDNEISLSELKNVTLTKFQEDMDKNDDNPHDNDGDLIAKFPEFRYFAGVDGLGSSFYDKDKLEEVGISGKIKSLSDDAFRGSAITSFTLPVTMTTVGAHPFNGSGLENYEVELDHDAFTTDNGVLLSKDKSQLVSVPNGRKGTSVVVPDYVKTVAGHAVYKLPEVEEVYIDAADYDYETVLQRSANSFVPKDGKKFVYYIEDATYDESSGEARELSFDSRRAGSEETGEGNGHLFNRYKEHEFWKDEQLKKYFELKVNANSKDADGNYWATMYIGWDTQLPEGLTAYIVDKDETKETSPTLVLRKISNKVPRMTPVVIKATEAKTYTLYPSKEKKWADLPMSENLLDGVNRYGLDVNQSDANDGGCLTLGKNKSGKVGFFIYKGKEKIPCYRAYISVNKVGESREFLLSIDDDEATGIDALKNTKTDADGDYYNLSGQRVERPSKGVYIHNGRKIIKR